MKQRFLDFYKASTIPSSYDRIGRISNELYDNISIGDVLTIFGSIGYDGVYTVRNKLGGTNILELTTATFSATATTKRDNNNNNRQSRMVRLGDTQRC